MDRENWEIILIVAFALKKKKKVIIVLVAAFDFCDDQNYIHVLEIIFAYFYYGVLSIYHLGSCLGRLW